ncbi:MAG TPA: AAA family ATPase [Methylomirabilota bacterium]|nr:AAA family ATPase [Methylomirabilota bacterium]
MLTDHGPSPDSTRFDAVVAAWLDELDRRQEAGECADAVSRERLASVAAGSARAAEADAVRAHLTTCLPCLNAHAELLSVTAEPEITATVLAREGAFVGRHQELAMLQAALQRVRAGLAEVVCVRGAGGIGKSRILDELGASAAAAGAWVVRVRCAPPGASAPYAPLVDLLRGLCGLDERQPAESVRMRIDGAVERAGLSVAGIAPFLARLAGATAEAALDVVPEPSVMQEKIVQALAALAVHAGHDRPLVLQIEDLQWCDTASASCLARLVPALRSGRVLCVMTCRPDHPLAWLDAAGAVTITLSPFTRQEAGELLQCVVPDALTPELARQAIAKAEGNPLLLEELALALRDGRAAEAVTTAGPGAAVLRARFDTLGPYAHRLLHIAAVLGPQGSLDVVETVADLDAVAFAQALGELQARGWLVGAPDGSSRYVFRHTLIQETAYDGLAPDARAALHGAVARALETHADGSAEILAHHAARSDDDERAVHHALAAARAMTRRAANAETVEVLTAAAARLGRMPDTPDHRRQRIDVVLEQAEARFGLGQHTEQIEAMRGIAALVEAHADARRAASWHYWMGFLHRLTGGRTAEAIEHCRTASRIADAAGLDEVYAYSESCLCQVLATAGELREAIDSGKRALGIFEASRNAWWSCRTLWHLASAALYLGQWQESIAFCQRALEHGRAVADSRLMAVAWLRLGAAHVHRGEWETGVLYCDEAARLTHTDFDAAMLRVNRGYGLVRGQQYDAGIASIEAGVEWFRRAGLRFSQLNAELRLAEAWLRAGRADDAVRLARSVLAGAREIDYRHLEAVAQALLGDALVDVDAAEAEVTLEAAEAVLEEVGALNDLARVKVAQARLTRATGDARATVSLLRSALRLFEALGTADEAAAARAALVRAQGRP